MTPGVEAFTSGDRRWRQTDHCRRARTEWQKRRKPRSRIGTIITVVIIVIIGVLIWQRRTEQKRLLHRIAVGTPAEQMAAVRRLVDRETLADAMDEAPRWVQENTVTAIERMADRRAFEQMIAAKSLLDAPVEERCNRILVLTGRPVIAVLVDSIRNKDGAIRGAAIAPLQRIGEPVVAPVVALADAWDQYVRDCVRDVLAVIGTPATKPLMDIIYQYQPPEGASAAKHLRRRGTAIATLELMKAPAIPALLEGLKKPEPEIRGAIVTMLGHIADQSIAAPLPAAEAEKVIKPMLAALEDSEWTVRRKAAEALGPMFAKTVASPTLEGTNPLVAYLKTPDVPKHITSVLIGHLDDLRAEVKAGAAQSLGLVADPVAAGPLAKTLMVKPSGAWKELGLALERIGPAAVPAVANALATSPDPNVRIVATDVLANIGGATSVENTRPGSDRPGRRGGPATRH